MRRQVSIISPISEVSRVLNDSAYDVVKTVKDNIEDVLLVSKNKANIDVVVDNINGINALAGSAPQIHTVGTHINNINTIATDITNVDTVASNMINVNNIGTNINSVKVVASKIYSIDTISDNIAGVSTVSGNITSVSTIADKISNINTVADNIRNVNFISDNINDIKYAKIAETNAKNSENAAKASEINAEKWASNPEDKVVTDGKYSSLHYSNKSADSALAAKTSEVNAANSEASAKKWASNDVDVKVDSTYYSSYHYAIKAAASAKAAKASGVKAKMSEDKAKMSEDKAKVSEDTAKMSADNAKASADKAYKWANESENSLVDYNDPNGYSAYHWAKKTEDYYIKNIVIGDRPILDFNYNFSSTTIEGALEELATRFDTLKMTQYYYTALEGQTVFTDSDINGVSLKYKVGFVDVYLNGILLDKTDYDAVDGRSVSIHNSAKAGDELYIVTFGTSIKAKRFRYLATDGQTVFTDSDANGSFLYYKVGLIDVFLNGVHLDKTDYAATDGRSVVLKHPTDINDNVQIIAFGSSDIIKRYRYIAEKNQTVFSGADSNGIVPDYSDGNIIIYLNGVHISPSDYNITDDQTITLNQSTSSHDELYIVKLKPLEEDGYKNDTLQIYGDGFITDFVKEDGTFTFDLRELHNKQDGNLSFFIIVTVFNSKSDSVGSLLLHVIKPFKNEAFVSTISAIKASNINKLTSDPSDNIIKIVTDKDKQLRIGIKSISIGGLN